ncbi:hypothetical protein SS50377_25985 [Spironucleus salmonicida]|uniref:Uncharacterized protein n=1 Tax=Spironucleus salmonicida TaxID=348837 RepID=V6LR40_9EUKA|nr:hypothetical protein SS50377_25985 [Spironucleus salmonicida]|eukprot:EST43229.1 Hypothetical protein SS50377_17094 [Spironucleus salmonicida]
MLIFLQFTCYEYSSTVQYEYISASVLFIADPLIQKIAICTYLHGSFAIPMVSLGNVIFTAPQITFSSNQSIELRLECPIAFCIDECKSPIDVSKCKACKENRQLACKDAALASIAKVNFNFHDKQIEMIFSPSSYQVVAYNANSCLLRYTVQYYSDKIIYHGVPFLCELQISDTVKALMVAKKCKYPIKNVPQDCPWVQLVVNNQILNIKPYYDLNLLGLNEIEIDCGSINPQSKDKCYELVELANSKVHSNVSFQLAVVVDRNLGNISDIDMKTTSVFYYKGIAQTIDLISQSDCFSSISSRVFQDHINLSLKVNTSAIHCQQGDYDRVNVEISGKTKEFYMIQNTIKHLQHVDENIIISVKNSRNSTEFNGNLSIVLNGQRSEQFLNVQSITDDNIVYMQEYIINNTSETFRNVTVTLFDRKICVTTQPVPWVQREFNNVNFLLHVGQYQFQWQQQLLQIAALYCYEITDVQSDVIVSTLNQPQTVLYFNIDRESLPIFQVINAKIPDIYWKQLVILLMGMTGFSVVVILRSYVWQQLKQMEQNAVDMTIQ